MERRCGILLPVASLPNPYGIGCFSKEAYEFVDYLAQAGQRYWQILPLGQTGYGDSPYQSCSTFAGNAYFIDPVSLIDKGYLTQEQVDGYDFGGNHGYVDYDKIYKSRFKMLKAAYKNSPFAKRPKKKWAGEAYDKERADFMEFLRNNWEWIVDYAAYSAIKDKQKGKAYVQWPDGLRYREDEAMRKAFDTLKDEIRFYEYIQYEFFKQWEKLKSYANEKGILIIGDLPIYVAFDSADTWANPKLFELDEKGYPIRVAGCPPDSFAKGGQLWGNPLYNWEAHKQTEYHWWMKRIQKNLELYDVLRIDHFRGFESYYAIPYEDEDATGGEWVKGPGKELFEVLHSTLGDMPIIAEDLGFITQEVRDLLAATGYPGMKVMQFGYGEYLNHDYLPQYYPKNCIAYTGTHDNDTLRNWYKNHSKKAKDTIREELKPEKGEEMTGAFLKTLFASNADTVIVPMQDYLMLGEEARINTPSTLGGLNWRWRMKASLLTEKRKQQMLELAKAYGRENRL
ncbi:MAG: 4-alpha-glucanotransferase [Eubacterium sp.]|nr:4-alpha-glucanotransferase [Eubacterium sp.]